MKHRIRTLYGHAPAGNEFGHAPVGMDAMVASPTNFTQAVHLGEFAQQQASGMTSITTHDAGIALMHAENAVKTAMANGATRDEAIAAAGHYANGNPELASIVQDAAGKQYDSNKNPLAAAAGEGKEASATMHTLGTMLGLGVAAEAVAHEPTLTAAAAERQPLFGKIVLEDHERPLDENGRVLSTTATIAALEQFRPQAGLPIPQREQGLQRA